jgi:hypothetical protein
MLKLPNRWKETVPQTLERNIPLARASATRTSASELLIPIGFSIRTSFQDVSFGSSYIDSVTPLAFPALRAVMAEEKWNVLIVPI